MGVINEFFDADGFAIFLVYLLDWPVLTSIICSATIAVKCSGVGGNTF